MNVLLTCAGRRNYLVRYFKDALSGTGRVCAADASEYAPALQEADLAFIVPPLSDENYIDHIQDICERHRIRLLISLNDLELPLLASQRERFISIGTIPVISCPEVIRICFDKWITAQFLRDNGLNAPSTFITLGDAKEALANRQITFPMIVKPRWGTASIGIFCVHDMEELELAYRWLRKSLPRGMLAGVSQHDRDHSVVIQEALMGIEYGLDVVDDLQGSYVATFAKRKIGMRAGETDKAVTVQDERLEELGYRLAQALGHVGNLDCDVFATEKGLYVLEMNPRFGGGYPFSHVAGANVPAALIAWAEGREADNSFFCMRSGFVSSKYDSISCWRDKVGERSFSPLPRND